MSVLVSESHIIIRFGIGIFNKKIRLSEIRFVRTLTNPIYYGYGIPNGILYTISGNNVLEVRFKKEAMLFISAQLIWITSDKQQNQLCNYFRDKPEALTIKAI